jgi:hypothetical protein
LPFSDGDPRVFLVTSINGGTGGGMLVEMSYLIRQALAETGLSDEHVCGLLTYSAARGKRAPCLDAGNAYSCLDELRYFSSAEHDYPGEPARGLLGFREDRAPLPHTYLIEMDGLGTDDIYEEQVDRLAKYLALNTVSSASVFFDSCRAMERQHRARGQFSLRTVGMLPLTATSSSIELHWVDELCRSLTLKWQGVASDSFSGLHGPGTDCNDHPASGNHPPRANDTEAARREQLSVLDELTSELAEMLLCDCDQIMTTVRTTVSDALGQIVDEYVHEVAIGIANERQTGDNGSTTTSTAVLARIHEVLGVDNDASSSSENTTKSLRHTAVSEAQRLAEVGKRSMRDRLFELAEKGPGRIAGALGVVDRLSSLMQATRDAVNQRFQTTQLKRKQLADGLAQQRLCRRLNWRVRGDCQAARFEEYAHLLLKEIICEAACRMQGLLSSSVKQCRETLHDLSRLLGQIGVNFQPGPESTDDGTKVPPQKDCPLFRIDSAATIFADHLEEMVEELEQEIQSHCFSAGRRLTGLLDYDSAMQKELVSQMRTHAKRVISNCVESVTQTQLETSMNGACNQRFPMQLEDLLKSVTPGLLKGGGTQHLALLGPTGEILGPLQERIAEIAGEDINAVATSEGDVFLCCEAEGIQFESVAANLMTSQPDCKKLASRLHTRVDVRW